MSESVQGIVEYINKNDSGFYSVKLGGEYFGAGKYAPKFKEGDEVKFNYTMNGKYKNLEFGTVSVLESGAATTSTPSSAGSSGGTNWDLKDKRITFLACRKDAIEIAKMAFDRDAITLPTKKADRLEVITAFVDEVADGLYGRLYKDPFNGEDS